MDKNKIFSVVIIGGVAVAALYILTKSGTLQEAIMGSGVHAGYASQDGDAGPATIYQFPAEPAINFPTLPTFQEVFPQQPVGSFSTTPAISEPYVAATPLKKSTSSSAALNVNETVGGGILTGILGMIMGPTGFLAGPAVALAGQTKIGASVKSVIGNALSGPKKEVTSSMGGFGSSGSPAPTLTPYQQFLSIYGFGGGSSGSSSSSPSKKSTTTSPTVNTTVRTKTPYGGSSYSGYGGGGVGGR
jgi:hypothetical protein